MSYLLPDDLEAYIESHSMAEPELLSELARVTREKTEHARMLSGPVAGGLLQLLIRVSGAKRVLEIGTFTGYSSLAMAAALPDDGELITCDVNERWTRIARQFWDRSPHGDRIRLELGDALQTVARLEGVFDMVFIDADKTRYVAYWEAVVDRVPAGGLIVADNVLWSGRVLAPQEDDDHAIVRFNDHVRDDRRVEAIILSIRDGLTVARRM